MIHGVENYIAGIILAAVGHGEPDFITGEGKNRGEHFGKAAENQIQSSLGTPAEKAGTLFTVEPVFNDVQIEAGELHYTEIINGVGNNMEFIVVISFCHFLNQGIEFGDGPAVKLLHIFRRHEIGIRVKVREVAEAVSGSVAEFEILCCGI